MQFLAIVLVSIGAAVCYGIVHDQVTARVCLEYFTVAHPAIFPTRSPTLLALGWGIIATWWVGLLLGMPLAAVARWGRRRPPLSWRAVLPSILRLLCVMACCAFAAGMLGYVAGLHGIVPLSPWLKDEVPLGHQAAFVAAWWTHLASYLAGFVGGIVVIVRSWRARINLRSPAAA